MSKSSDLREALKKLIDSPESDKAFVVVEGAHGFVQFYKNDGLIIADMPCGRGEDALGHAVDVAEALLHSADEWDEWKVEYGTTTPPLFTRGTS